MAFDELDRQDAEAVLRARQELGPAYDADLVSSFADRIEKAVEARVNEHAAQVQRRTTGFADAGRRQLTLGIVSLGTGIPLTAIAGGLAGLPGVVTAWVGIVGVNAASALAFRRK